MRTSNTSRLFQFAIVIAMVAFACTLQAQTLTHSYTFTDLSGNISSGTAVTNQATGNKDATLYTVGSGSAEIWDGVLYLNGWDVNNGAYIQLPSDLIGSKTSVTLQTWVTADNFYNWSRVWDIGGGAEANRFFNAFTEGTTAKSMAKIQAGITATQYYLTAGRDYLLTVTAETKNNTTTLSYFVDGLKVGTATGTIPLSQVSGNQNYLGKSFWSDSLADANYTEFNVYEGTMNTSQVKAESIMGASSKNSGYNRSATLNTATAIESVIATANSFWDFASCNTSSNVAQDLSGHGNTITNQNSGGSRVIESTQYEIANALTSTNYFFTDDTGTNNWAYTNDSDLMNLAGSGAFTLAGRVNFSQLKSDNYNDIIRAGKSIDPSKYGDTIYNANYAMAVHNGQLVFYGNDSNGNFQEYALSGLDVSTYTWYDFAISFDPGDADVANDSTISLYAYDSSTGKLIAKQSYSNLAITSFQTNSGDCLLFETPWNNHGNESGMMSYFGTWKTALGESQLGLLVAQANTNTEAKLYAVNSSQLTPGTIDGSTLYGVQFNSTTSPSSSNLTISVATALNYSSEYQIGNGYTLTQSGVLSGDGSLIKTGDGTLKLNAVNTYTGSTVVSDGTLVLSAKDAVKSSYTFANNANVLLEADQQLNNMTGSGTIDTNGQTLTANNTVDTTYSGIISGNGGLNKTGNRTLYLTGGNTYTGNVDITEGTLQVGYNANKTGAAVESETSLGDPTVEGRTVTVHKGASIEMVDIDVFGGANAYPKFTIVADGGSILTSASQLTSFGDIVLKNGGTFAERGGHSYWKTILNGKVSVTEGDATITSTGNGICPAGYVDGWSQGVTFDVAKGSTLTVSAMLTNTNNGSWYGSVIKDGEGAMILSNSGSYFTGNVTVNNGVLKVTGSWNSNNKTCPLGKIQDGRKVYVNEGGELVLAAQDIMSNSGYSSPIQIIVDGGKMSNEGTVYNNLTNVVLKNGAQVYASNGNDPWQAFKFSGTLSVLRDKASADPVTISSDLSKSKATIGFGHTTSIYVEDVTSEYGELDDKSDLIISAVIATPNSESNRTYNKTGTGILELTAANTNNGNVNINEGVLRLTGNGNLGSATATVNGGSLEFAHEGNISFGSGLNGSGAINKTGTGVLSLTSGHMGDNYTGTFTISNGTVKFASTDLFGDAGNVHNERFIIDGATVTNFNTFNKFNTLTLQNGATLEANGGKEASWHAYMLVGTTSVLKTTDTEKSKIASKISAGTVSGANAYGTINPNGTDFYIENVTEDDASDLIVSAVLANVNSIVGTFTKSGEGTMELQAANTYTGDTTINGGTIKLTNAGTLGTGTVTNYGTLEFAHDSDKTFSNTISGTGKLCKTGAGVLYLNGTDTNSISAAQFDVTAGTLMFKGKFTGNLNVGNGTDAVTLSPGNSVGVLDVDGNVDVASNATLWFEQDATGMDEIIVESGHEFTIADDAILELTMGQPISGATYTIIENGSDFTGDYANDSFWNSLLTPGSNYYWNLSVDGNKILAQIDPNAVPEPSTWALLILGTVSLMWLRKRK